MSSLAKRAYLPSPMPRKTPPTLFKILSTDFEVAYCRVSSSPESPMSISLSWPPDFLLREPSSPPGSLSSAGEDSFFSSSAVDCPQEGFSSAAFSELFSADFSSSAFFIQSSTALLMAISTCSGFKTTAARFSSLGVIVLSLTYSSSLPSAALLTSSDLMPRISSMLTPKISASSGSLEISGIEFPLSQFDTAWKLTPIRSASSSWVMFLPFLSCAIFLPTLSIENISSSSLTLDATITFLILLF